MKVIILRSNPVDPEPRIEKEAKALLESGFSVEIICWNRGVSEYLSKDTIHIGDFDIPIYRFNVGGKFGGGFKYNIIPLIRFQYKMFCWLFSNRKNYNFIHACDFDTALTGTICAKLFSKKMVYDIFDYYVDMSYSLNSFLRKIVKYIDDVVISNADYVIICSEKRYEQIRDANPKHVAVIHNSPEESVDIDKLYLSNNHTSLRLKIAYVGVLQPRRMIIELMEIVAQNQNCELHIAGYGSLLEEVRAFSLAFDNIKFYGKVNYKEALALEASCDVIVALYDPSIKNHIYAAPNKFYEALMLGKPLIMAKNTGVDDVVSLNNFGKVIDYNKLALQNAIEGFIGEKNEFSSLLMKQYYAENFAWSTMKRKLLTAYNQML